jgi:hypothetical protein
VKSSRSYARVASHRESTIVPSGVLNRNHFINSCLFVNAFGGARAKLSPLTPKGDWGARIYASVIAVACFVLGIYCRLPRFALGRTTLVSLLNCSLRGTNPFPKLLAFGRTTNTHGSAAPYATQ